MSTASLKCCNVSTTSHRVHPYEGSAGSVLLAQGGEVWWRLDCMVLDADEQPVNASASGWSSCADALSNGPR